MAKADWQGFSNIRLETHHKKAIKKLADGLGEGELMGWLLTILDSGYKFTLSPDDENNAIVASLTGIDADGPNAGYTMTQRHADPIIALCALKYAHDVIAAGGNWDSAQEDWLAVDW